MAAKYIAEGRKANGDSQSEEGDEDAEISS